MKTLVSAALLALGTFVVETQGAQAATEFCFTSGLPDSNPFAVVVHPKPYVKPPRGTCKPLNGVEVLRSPTRLVTGTVCLNAKGDRLLVSFTIPLDTETSRVPLDVSLSLPYPSMQHGQGQATEDGAQNITVLTDVLGTFCPAFPIP